MQILVEGLGVPGRKIHRLPGRNQAGGRLTLGLKVGGLRCSVACSNPYAIRINIGSDQEISILDLANKVKQLTHSESEIVLVHYDEAYEEGFEDMPRRVPDTSKINQLVGFKPEMTLDGILETVISFHRGRPASFDD